MNLADREIRTERLLLRRYREDDLDRLAAIQSLPEVARFLYWEPRSREEVAPALAKRIAATRLEHDDDVVTLAVERREDGLLLGPTPAATVTRPRRPALSSTSPSTKCTPTASSPAPTPATPPPPPLLRRIGMREEAHFREAELFFAILDREWSSPA